MPPPTLSEDEHNLGTLDKKPPMVHYPSDVKGPPSPDHHGVGLPHTDTVSSRASSVVGTDDEDDDGDDYDWSGEEDLVDEEAKFEKSMTSNRSHGRRWGFRRILSFLLGSLIGSIFTAGLLVTGPILLRIFWYNPHKSDHRLYVLENVEAWLFWAAAQLIVSWFLALIVDIVPPIVSGIISITWGHVSEYVKTRLELYIAVKNNIKVIVSIFMTQFCLKPYSSLLSMVHQLGSAGRSYSRASSSCTTVMMRAHLGPHTLPAFPRSSSSFSSCAW